MGFFAKLFDRMVAASWERARQAKVDTGGRLTASVERAPTTPVKTLTIHEAVNGQFIEFVRHKYNPNGPDDYRRELYIVRDNETLVDAISTVLVLTEK